MNIRHIKNAFSFIIRGEGEEEEVRGNASVQIDWTRRIIHHKKKKEKKKKQQHLDARRQDERRTLRNNNIYLLGIVRTTIVPLMVVVVPAVVLESSLRPTVIDVHANNASEFRLFTNLHFCQIATTDWIGWDSSVWIRYQPSSRGEVCFCTAQVDVQLNNGPWWEWSIRGWWHVSYNKAILHKYIFIFV